MSGWSTIEEIVSYSGLSKRTVQRWLHASEHPIPHHRVGGRVLINAYDFDRWVREHARSATRLQVALDRAMAGLDLSS